MTAALQQPALGRYVARGFIPVRLRSSRKILGPLRDPTGINPLATLDSSRYEIVRDRMATGKKKPRIGGAFLVDQV